jgi:hypothetical protein
VKSVRRRGLVREQEIRSATMKATPPTGHLAKSFNRCAAYPPHGDRQGKIKSSFKWGHINRIAPFPPTFATEFEQTAKTDITGAAKSERP